MFALLVCARDYRAMPRGGAFGGRLGVLGILTVNCALHSAHAYTAISSTLPVCPTRSDAQSGHFAGSMLRVCNSDHAYST